MDLHINIFLSKKLAQFLKHYTQFRTARSDYSAKLAFFDLHTLMKIIQIFMCHLCYIII